MKFGQSSALRYGTKNKILKRKNISDFIIIKNFCILKDMINKIKSYRLGKIFANYTSDEEFEFRKYEQYLAQ